MRSPIHEFGQKGEEIHHGSDSTVTIPKDAHFVYKDYHSLREDDIRRYAQLHNILSNEILILQISEELQKRFGMGIKQVRVCFLDIGQDISSYGRFTRHQIQLVPGDVLGNIGKHVDFLDNNSNTFIDYLEKEISYFVSKRLGISDRLLGSMNSFYIFSGNIKIVRVDKNILTLMVTDIGSTISRLLLENKEAIDRILQTPS